MFVSLYIVQGIYTKTIKGKVNMLTIGDIAMPLGKNVRRNMSELTDAHPDWTRKRRLKASLNAAREHGARIPVVRRKGKVRKGAKRKRR